MDNEFRVFVCADKLTAVSQYDHYSCYPHVARQRGEILRAIREAWRVIHPHLGVDSYCLDVAYVAATGTCVMIELSPFLACTGSALFSWSSPADLLILEGKAPFEFRLKNESSLHPQLEDLLEINWDDRWSRLAAQNNADSAYRYDQFFDISAEEYDAQALTTAARGGLYVSSLMLGAAIAVRDMFSSITASVWGGEQRSPGEKLVFMYGTLKRGFQWNQKYLHQRPEPGTTVPYSRFVSTAITKNKHVLLIGDCGVPYLSLWPSLHDSVDIDNECGHIVGELWAVSSECLRNLDAYEGTEKGYYRRDEVSVCVPQPGGEYSEQEAYVYNLSTPLAELKSIASLVPLDYTRGEGKDSSCDTGQHLYPRAEYTFQQHQTLYNPVQHIQVKQLNYIQHQPSHWGHSLQPALEVSAEAAAATTTKD